MMKPQTKILIQKIIAGAAALTSALLVMFLLKNTHPALYYSLIIGSFALGTAAFCIKADKHSSIFKLIFTIIIVLLIYVVSHIAMVYSGLSQKIKSAEDLKEIILSTGNWSLVVFFLVTLLQVIVLPIPAAITVVAGTYIYGPTVSFVVSALGTLAGSVVCFYLGRIFGKKLIAWIIGAEKTEKYSKIITEKGKIPFIAMMLFPFFPDDILCMTAGLTKMSFRFFIIAISLTRPVMLAFYSYFGGNDVLPYNAWGITVRVLIFVAFVFLMFLVKFLYEKSKNKPQYYKVSAFVPVCEFSAELGSEGGSVDSTSNNGFVVYNESNSDIKDIRREVFIIEQCIDEDEEKDSEDINYIHCAKVDGDRIVAYARFYIDGLTAKIGRVAVRKELRGTGTGKEIIDFVLNTAKSMDCEKAQLNAQVHCTGFYEKCGFRKSGKEFFEIGIRHIKMSRNI